VESRASRAIALAALLMASLAVVAVLGPEHPRSTAYTLILWAAIVVAIGTLALLIGTALATPYRVVRRDIRTWRIGRDLDKHWQPTHYTSGNALKPGSPFIGRLVYVLAMTPPREGFPPVGLPSPLEGAAVSCVVEGRGGRFSCIEAAVDPFGVRARWPEELVNLPGVRPVPGRYKARWEIRLLDGGVISVTQKLHFGQSGALLFGPARRLAFRLRRAWWHLKDEPW
jgi:hypothetical protein